MPGWLPASHVIPGTDRVIGRFKFIIEMARRHLGSFELYGTGSTSLIRAAGASPPPAQGIFHSGRPQLVGPFHVPKRLTFPCQAWDRSRILSEGWDVLLDAEEGHYITFRCWTACPPTDHHVDIRAHATARAGLTWAALPGGIFFTRGWDCSIPGIWARP